MRKNWIMISAVMILAVSALYGCGNKTALTDTSEKSSEIESSTAEWESAPSESVEESTKMETSESLSEPNVQPSASATEQPPDVGAEPTEGEQEDEPVPENFYGTWYGAQNSLDGEYYTGYLKLELTETTCHTVDQEAGNPGFDADIIKVTSDKLILNPSMMESAPAAWKLEEGKEAEITYKNPDKYELWLTYDGITCIFYRGMTSSDLAGAAGDFIDPYIGPYWKSTEGGSLGILFGYYDLQFVDMSQKGRVLLSGKMIIDAENNKAEVIPDITQGLSAIAEWPEIAEGTHFTMELEHYGEEEIQITCFGKPIRFEPAELN